MGQQVLGVDGGKVGAVDLADHRQRVVAIFVGNCGIVQVFGQVCRSLPFALAEEFVALGGAEVDFQ